MTDYIETYHVDGRPVTFAITEVHDDLYATAVDSDRLFLERVWKYMENEGWALDEITQCGPAGWFISMWMESSGFII